MKDPQNRLASDTGETSLEDEYIRRLAWLEDPTRTSHEGRHGRETRGERGLEEKETFPGL